MVLLALAVVVPTITFIALSLKSVQNGLRQTAESELSNLLGADVTIEELIVRPFNRVRIRGVAVTLEGDTILKLSRVAGGVNLYELLWNHRPAFSYAEIIGLDVRVWRDSANAPLNIDPIIKRLSKPDEDKRTKEFFARVNTVVIRSSSASYDVLSEPLTPGRFNPSHIKINDLRADVSLPVISNKLSDIDLKRLAFDEAAGASITDLHTRVAITPESVAWDSISVAMPRSLITMAPGKIGGEGRGIPQALQEDMTPISIVGGSHIYLPDLQAFVPLLEDFPMTVGIELNAKGGMRNAIVEKLNIKGNDGIFDIAMNDVEVLNINDIKQLRYKIEKLTVSAGGNLTSRLNRAGILKMRNAENLADFGLSIKSEGGYDRGEAKGEARYDKGLVDFAMNYKRLVNREIWNLSGEIEATDFDLGTTFDKPELGLLNGRVEADATLGKTLSALDVTAQVYDFQFKKHSYDDISAHLVLDGSDYSGEVSLNDDGGDVQCDFSGSLARGAESLKADVAIRHFNPNALNLTDKYPGYSLSADISAEVTGRKPQDIMGHVGIRRFSFGNPEDKTLRLGAIDLSREPGEITFDTDFMAARLDGEIEFATIGAIATEMAAKAFPALRPDARQPLVINPEANKFTYEIKITDTETLADFFNLPVSVIYPMTIGGRFDAETQYADLNLNAPYLRQGNKVIEKTKLNAVVDGEKGIDKIEASLSTPSKDGLMAVNLLLSGKNNKVDTDIDWKIDRKKLYCGNVSFSSELARSGGKFPMTDVAIHASNLVFNDSVWNVSPATISYDGYDRVVVDDLEVSRSGQFVKIDGVASPAPTDTLTVNVLNLSLDYVFDTLAIDAVELGGDATGEIYASQVISPAPHLFTEGIRVKDISYNQCHFGDALVKSWWDIDSRAVDIDAEIYQTNGRTSTLFAEIFPIDSRLDIKIHADETPAGFLHKYMKAFASDITGTAGGDVRLYGTFHDVDLVGRLKANDLGMRINFTNVYYTASDSVIMTPGRIDLRNIRVTDRDKHTALLNGALTHDFMRDAAFKFQLSKADNLLVFDQTAKDNPDWYGRVFVNGGATIEGAPGIVKIDVEATTARGSIFTFVLSNLEVADEYTFLTFRDKGKENVVIEETEVDHHMGIVNRLKALAHKQDETTESNVVIELRVGITPEAEIDLVMDPVSGDKIRSRGTGNMRLVYISHDNDLSMMGKYTLENGTYNFTLQDIIIKEFKINDGSSISFTGDPLKARLDISAIYSLNANLSDLDESFLQDKDLNRTSVPVQAILNVKGDIQQPEISFDLGFPTLTSDAYRKVRSIVSTEEMMNRQIIYLLALNRFYTPDYMGSTTKGNELFSVASSTITSQLSNMLGHLSDKWAISPNLRSDRGDFSDVEVDVALSSRLLNNRLLLNGNFGYRDKTLNTNQFVGDFDVEYLLNRSGNVRLKAYSHSNDENYYVRTAATTQGLGIMYKRDFDNIFGFLRRHPRRPATPADTISASPQDTIPPAPIDTIPPAPQDTLPAKN